MPEQSFNYDDVSHYTLEDPDIRALIGAQDECTFMWGTQDGWPVGVIMSYVFKDACFWLSVSALPPGLSLTYKGICQVHADQDTINWFLPALAQRLRPGNEKAQALFVELNNTPNRRVIQFNPTKTIGFDGRKMGQATKDGLANKAHGTRQ